MLANLANAAAYVPMNFLDKDGITKVHLTVGFQQRSIYKKHAFISYSNESHCLGLGESLDHLEIYN